MPVEPVDAFDFYDPTSCPDYDRRAELYFQARLKEWREKQPRVPQGNDLNTMFREGGDSGECVDGQIAWESEKRELVEKILAARKREISTQL